MSRADSFGPQQALRIGVHKLSESEPDRCEP